ncbi:hypothetical protein OROMI_031483 [Orobanche minor]
MARYLRADSDNFLATNKNGDYTLTYKKFIGDGIIAKRCRFRYASYFKIIRGDKIHLVGIGVITETNGDYWLGIENRLFIDKFGDNIALTRILVFEMSKDLLSRWNHLASEDSDDEFEVMADDDIANLNTEPLEQVFENLLADMFDDEDKSNRTDIDVLGKALKIC